MKNLHSWHTKDLNPSNISEVQDEEYESFCPYCGNIGLLEISEDFIWHPSNEF